LLDMAGDYQRGDFITVNHTSLGGGRNTAKCLVTEEDTAEQIAQGLAAIINSGISEWNAGHFSAAADGAMLQIMCADEAGEVAVSGAVEDGSPSGGRKFEVTLL
jgi:hypothetical protein